MEIRTAGVVGLGTMGAGIVEVFSRSGLDVIAVEINDALLEAGRGRLEKSLGKAVDRGRLDAADRDATLARVRFTTDRADLSAADLVTEAIPERLDVKTALFAELAEICRPDAVLATNTSSLPITEIAAATGGPGRVVGMHFFNPAPVMKLVEVVHTVLTDGDVVDGVRSLAQRCGKTPVVVTDRAGFVANALLFGYLNDAARAVETGQAEAADIDAAIVAATGFPMGPLTLLDLIGLDVSLDVLETMFTETRDQRYAPAPLLRRKVMAGQLGRKSGRGYHRYDNGQSEPAGSEAPDPSMGQPMKVVTDGQPSRLAEALGDIELIAWDADFRGAVIDGGSAQATIELASRVVAHNPTARVAVAVSDDVPLAALAAGIGRPHDLIGLHAPRTPRAGVVEVVHTTRTTEGLAQGMARHVAARGITAVVCRDRPGYVVDRLLLPHLGDAVRMVDDGYASRDDVDTAMRLGCGYPDGPFAMLEAIGPDQVRSTLLHLAAATHLPSLAPSPLLDELAAYDG